MYEKHSNKTYNFFPFLLCDENLEFRNNKIYKNVILELWNTGPFGVIRRHFSFSYNYITGTEYVITRTRISMHYQTLKHACIHALSYD